MSRNVARGNPPPKRTPIHKQVRTRLIAVGDEIYEFHVLANGTAYKVFRRELVLVEDPAELERVAHALKAEDDAMERGRGRLTEIHE